MTICSVLFSLCEGVVGGRDATGAPLGKTQFPNLYNDARARILRRTAATTRYLRERVGGGEDVSSVVETGSYAVEDMCVESLLSRLWGFRVTYYRCT